jgi:hypothetical protein
MARVTFGNIVAEARGKVGGVVFSRNTGGAYVRAKVSPVQPRTPAQLNQRSRLTEVSKVWGTLTQAQREAWKSFSIDYKKRDVLGLGKQRSAQQMFMFCNLALDSVGYALILNPPVGLSVDALTVVNLVSATSGAVQSVAVGTAGTGYTSVPAVTFTGGGGSSAAGTASLVPTSVATVSVGTAGTGYTSAPTVNIVGGGGSGATATAAIASGGVTAITVTNGGTGYTSVPSVIVTGGGGTGTVATAVLTGTGVAGVTITNGGSSYTSNPTVGFTGGGGTAAAATSTITLATSDLAISYTPSAIPQSYEGIEVWMTGPYAVGRTFVKSQYRYVALLQQPDVSPVDITAAWENVFGGLPVTAPYKISVRARIINSLNGARSEWTVGTLLQLP